MKVTATASAKSFGTVTKSDSTELLFNAIYVGTAGDVAVSPTKDGTGDAVTFTGVPAGSILPVAGKRVMSTGTTADAMVWLLW